MMEPTNEPQRLITVNERVPSHRFHRFVDEKLRAWIRDQGYSENDFDFEVAFFDEEPLGEVSCLIVIQSADRMWRSWETSDNPRFALLKSLEHLKVGFDEASPVTAGDKFTQQIAH
jgi:hypothetical protein